MMKLEKEQWEKILSIVLSAALAVFAVLGWVIDPVEIGSGWEVEVPGGDEIALGTSHFSGLNVTGATDLDSTLNVDGAATFNSTMDIDGAMTFNGAVDIDGNLTSGTGVVTITDGVLIDGAEDGVQLTVQGYTTQTSNLLTLEDSSGTDLFVVDGSGNLATAGEFDEAVLIDGEADEVQLTVQGYTTQTNSLLVLENSGGTDQFTVSNSGAVDAVGEVQYGASDFYPIGYGTAGYAFDFGTSTVTDTLSLTMSNVTTPTVGFCTLGADADAAEALCSISISGTGATLKLWNAGATGAGSAGTSVHWMIIGED